ncbi:hypothetical protein BU16DRAFT_538798 [Lophium mytilinum]|uniref:Uncharacterized protein n=1 Tax=Lophium mytilinum TaxID=390894 RepID=A0A6A6QVK4_9PEZI|nr:hypothetical protein BU16DRAFT_538798 [Lophium mytilinum]
MSAGEIGDCAQPYTGLEIAAASEKQRSLPQSAFRDLEASLDFSTRNMRQLFSLYCIRRLFRRISPASRFPVPSSPSFHMPPRNVISPQTRATHALHERYTRHSIIFKARVLRFVTAVVMQWSDAARSHVTGAADREEQLATANGKARRLRPTTSYWRCRALGAIGGLFLHSVWASGQLISLYCISANPPTTITKRKGWRETQRRRCVMRAGRAWLSGESVPVPAAIVGLTPDDPGRSKRAARQPTAPLASA